MGENKVYRAYYADSIYYESKFVNNSWLLTEGKKIVGITSETPDSYEKIVFKNSVIYPSLMNTHTHACMAYFRGYADDLPLMTWLNEHIWPAEKKWISTEFIKDSTLLACAELIRNGVSCFNDMYFLVRDMTEVLATTGLRGVMGCSFMDRISGSNDAYIDLSESLIHDYKDNDLIDFAFCPHALYTAAPERYKEAISFVQKNDIILHTHLSETEWEVDEIKKRYGMSPAMLMDSIGGFDDCRSIFAHCVHLTDEEIALLGKKNVNISHCIHSNLKLASGFAPMTKLMQAGANITIGTDGPASNNNMNILSEMKTAAIFHKAFSGDSTTFDAPTTFKCATENAANALGIKDTGVLKKGYSADFMVVNYSAPHMQPVYNYLSHLIYSAQASDITNLYVAGKPLMKDSKLTTIDESKLLDISKKWEERIKATKEDGK